MLVEARQLVMMLSWMSATFSGQTRLVETYASMAVPQPDCELPEAEAAALDVVD